MKTIDLAKDIIYLCTKHNISFNNTKIQKLLYLFVGFALINDIEPRESVQNEEGEEEISIIDELPKAWPYGPVFPKVHKQYNEIRKIPENYSISIQDLATKEILEKTIQKWGVLSASRLSEWSHEEGSPWDVVVKQQGSGWNTIIPLGLIREYFENEIINVIDESK